MSNENSSAGNPNPASPPALPSSTTETLSRQINQGAMRSWDRVWRDFLQLRQDWWNAVSRDRNPVYTLPAQVIELLRDGLPGFPARTAHPDAAQPPRFDVEAERAFRKVCVSYRASTIGVWDSRPVDFLLLAEPLPPITDELLRKLAGGRNDSIGTLRHKLAQAEAKAADNRRQMLGYAGALLLNSEYRSQRDELQAKSAQLRRPVPPPYQPGPVRAHVSPLSATPGHASPALFPDDLQAYFEAVQSFLVRWELAALVTWDLPLPQGPVELPASMLPSVLGTSPTVSHIPSYASPPSDVDLRKETRARQKLNAEAAGLAMPHPVGGLRGKGESLSTNETAFRMWLVELALRRRCGNPRGLVARLVPVFADWQGISTERVEQVRKLYSKLFQG
jgi:hypothetical protein